MNKLWSVVPEMKIMMREGLLCRQSGEGGGRGKSAERKADYKPQRTEHVSLTTSGHPSVGFNDSDLVSHPTR